MLKRKRYRLAQVKNLRTKEQVKIVASTATPNTSRRRPFGKG